jgi:hypothetical protein
MGCNTHPSCENRYMSTYISGPRGGGGNGGHSGCCKTPVQGYHRFAVLMCSCRKMISRIDSSYPSTYLPTYLPSTYFVTCRVHSFSDPTLWNYNFEFNSYELCDTVIWSLVSIERSHNVLLKFLRSWVTNISSRLWGLSDWRYSSAFSMYTGM